MTYDGDGRPAKRFENRHTETYEEVLWDEPRTVYYVRSTLLGGAPIIEFVPAGYGTTENIYLGSEKIASHFTDSNYVQWRHVNPATGSWLVSSVTTGGALANRNELDPLRTEMGTSDPYVSYTSYQDLMGLESLYEERGNPFDPSGGCGTIDGLPASCSEVSMRLRGGSLAAAYEERERDPSQSPFDPRPPRYIPVLRPIEDYGVGLYGVWVPGERSEFRKGRYLFFTDPQDPSSTPLNSDEISTLRTDVQDLLKNADCASFLKSVLEQLKADTGRQQYGTSDILTLFKAVETGRGFDWQPGLNAQARAGGGYDHQGRNIASMSIKPTQSFADLSNVSHSASRGRTVAHELFHVGGYDHSAMAKAAYAVGGRFDQSWRAWRGDFPDPENDPFFSGPNRNELLDGAYGGFFKNVLDQYCK